MVLKNLLYEHDLGLALLGFSIFSSFVKKRKRKVQSHPKQSLRRWQAIGKMLRKKLYFLEKIINKELCFFNICSLFIYLKDDIIYIDKDQN
jgi:hypothetical protein